MTAPFGPTLRFETPDYVFRSIVLGDETDEWGGWLANPRLAAMVNALPRARSLAELRKYISTFDRLDRHLFGIFEKASGRLIGIRTMEFDHQRRSFTQHVMVGDPDDRHQGAMYQSGEALVDWAYETCDMLYSDASVLAANRKMLRYMADGGWTVTGNGFSPDAVTGKFIDIVTLRRSRETWRKKPRSSYFKGEPAQTGLESAPPPSS